MMSSKDPRDVTDALEYAQDAFQERGFGSPDFEAGISVEADWETQLTKACRLLEVCAELQRIDGYYLAIIEVCFGAIERTLEAYCLKMGGDELRDFQNHSDSYRRAQDHGLFRPQTISNLRDLYGENRTDSYYGAKRPTGEQTAAMSELAHAIHDFTVDQIREGGVCTCE